MTKPVTRAGIFAEFDAFAASKGFDFDALLAKAGIARSTLADPDNEVSLNAVASLLNDAATECGDPCLGLHWAETYSPGAGGVLGYLLLNSRSVRIAVKAITRYVHLTVHPVEISFEEADHVGRMTWRFPASFTAPRVQYASFAMAIIIIRLRRAAGAHWYPMGVDLEHRELQCRDEVLRILGPNVRFDCGVNTLHIREAVLNRTTDAVDLRLFDLIRKLGDRMLDERKSAIDIVEQTRRVIVAQLERGDVLLDDVAAVMDISGRTLQYRLSAVETSFETLLQETRRDMAEIYMRDSDLPLTEIAFLLGFSELSAFTRAAGKWFGVAPRERRAELRRAGDAKRL